MVARCISVVQQVQFLRLRNADASYRFIILVNRRSRLRARHPRVTGMTRRAVTTRDHRREAGRKSGEGREKIRGRDRRCTKRRRCEAKNQRKTRCGHLARSSLRFAPPRPAGFDFFFAFFIVIFFLFLSYSFSSSSCSSYRFLLLLLYVPRVSRTIRRERPLPSVSPLLSSLLPLVSRQLLCSRIRPFIGAKQAHPLKRYATSLSTHGERERFTSRQYWSNVKPV